MDMSKPPGERDGSFDGRGRPNVYTCEVCRKRITSIDRDQGTTPFMIRCVATKGCAGMMVSACYNPKPQHVTTPTLEWINPTPGELLAYLRTKPKRYHQGIREHVAKGGLIEREVVRQ